MPESNVLMVGLGSEYSNALQPNPKYHISVVDTMRQCEALLKKRPWDAIVMDIRTPLDTRGPKSLEASLEKFQIINGGTEAPLLLITNPGDVTLESELIKHRPHDILRRPFEPILLNFKIERTLEFGTHKYDDLTGLYKKKYFESKVAQKFWQIKTHRERLPEEARNVTPGLMSLALVYYDLNDFGDINTILGHKYGDIVLTTVGGIIGQVRMGEAAGRVGGDEFAHLVFGTQSGACAVAERVCTLVNEYDFNKLLSMYSKDELPRIRVRMSAGIADTTLRDINTPEDLIHAADQSMYASKGENKSVIISTAGEDTVICGYDMQMQIKRFASRSREALEILKP